MFSSGSTDTINIIETYHSGGTIDKNTINVTGFGFTDSGGALAIIDAMSFNNSGGLLTINFGNANTSNPTLKFSLSNYSDYSGGNILKSGDTFTDVLQLHGSGATFSATINLADVYAKVLDGETSVFANSSIGTNNIVSLDVATTTNP